MALIFTSIIGLQLYQPTKANAAITGAGDAQDPAYGYPAGFISFAMADCSSMANISLTFVGSFDASKLAVRKYNGSSKAYTTLTTANSGLVVTATTHEGQPAVLVTYTITDNGLLDTNPVLGAISDPVGVGQLVLAVPNTGYGR